VVGAAGLEPATLGLEKRGSIGGSPILNRIRCPDGLQVGAFSSQSGTIVQRFVQHLPFASDPIFRWSRPVIRWEGAEGVVGERAAQHLPKTHVSRTFCNLCSRNGQLSWCPHLGFGQLYWRTEQHQRSELLQLPLGIPAAIKPSRSWMRGTRSPSKTNPGSTSRNRDSASRVFAASAR